MDKNPKSTEIITNPLHSIPHTSPMFSSKDEGFIARLLSGFSRQIRKGGTLVFNSLGIKSVASEFEKMDTDDFVGNISLVFFLVLCIHASAFWETKYESTALGRSWNITLYLLVTVGTMLDLAWRIARSLQDDGVKETAEKKWTAVMSMIPMIVGLLNVKKMIGDGELRNMGTVNVVMLATSAVILSVQHLSEGGMSWRQMGIVMIGSIMPIAGYLIKSGKYFMPTVSGASHRMYTGMIACAILLLFTSFVGGEARPGIASSAVFMMTLGVSIFVSWTAACEYSPSTILES